MPRSPRKRKNSQRQKSPRRQNSPRQNSRTRRNKSPRQKSPRRQISPVANRSTSFWTKAARFSPTRMQQLGLGTAGLMGLGGYAFNKYANRPLVVEATPEALKLGLLEKTAREAKEQSVTSWAQQHKVQDFNKRVMNSLFGKPRFTYFVEIVRNDDMTKDKYYYAKDYNLFKGNYQKLTIAVPVNFSEKMLVILYATSKRLAMDCSKAGAEKDFSKCFRDRVDGITNQIKKYKKDINKVITPEGLIEVEHTDSYKDQDWVTLLYVLSLLGGNGYITPQEFNEYLSKIYGYMLEKNKEIEDTDPSFTSIIKYAKEPEQVSESNLDIIFQEASPNAPKPKTRFFG
jgi:hypothetical protein